MNSSKKFQFEMKVLRYRKFLEAISGTELVTPIGPNYPSQKIPLTLSRNQTEVIFSDITSEFYTNDDYQSLYIDYLKRGGSPMFGFNRENLERILSSKINEGSNENDKIISSILGKSIPFKSESTIDGGYTVHIDPRDSGSEFIYFIEKYLSSQDVQSRIYWGKVINGTDICVNIGKSLNLNLFNVIPSDDNIYQISLIFYPVNSPIWKEVTKRRYFYN